ncbi:ABC transporter permease [Alkalihalobacterium elongatum]|uniref:ABC transporter permease n=1 Tax=Alkalihalobacterium elongatum TaxID=2675466 RepID=UPI001C1F7BB2|nr:ABC transporter permease [Alkalihalobacterium elongatum]
MRQWWVLFTKELLEMWRNFKWVWLPIVFLLLGMTDPLTSYFMPQILDTVGGLPEGAVIEMPLPSGNEVLLMVTSQLNMLGVLIIVLAFMGTIAGERKSGVTGMVLVKPVPFGSYVTAKWVALLLIGVISLFVGYLAGWYYGSILFDPIPFTLFIQSYLLLAGWYIFILTLTIFFNSIFRIPGLVAFVTLATVIVLSIITNTFERWMTWSPAQLTGNVGSLLMEGRLLPDFGLTVIVTLILLAVLIYSSIRILRSKELAE